ncbi:MAG: DUF4126 domain-containing protein [Sumerlaeia bacterium]
MDVLAALSVALGASFAAGINLYATVFVLGALSRWTGFDLPADLLILEHGGVLAVSAGLYTVEFFADKIPAVDSTWDAIHTFIRIPAGVIIAATALGDVPMEFQIMSGLIGGTLATTSHATKATTRLAAHSTGTSPVLGPIASLFEDVVATTTTVVAAISPIGLFILLGLLVTFCVFVLMTFWKLAKTVFRGLFGVKEKPDISGAAPA